MDAIAKKNQKRISLFDKGVYLLLAAAMLAVFLMPELGILCGPIMVLIFTYLFIYKDHEFVVAVILVANEALGAMVMGSLSFQYLLALLLVFRFFTDQTYTLRQFLLLLVALLFPLQLFAVGYIEPRPLLFSFIYILSVASIGFDRDPESAQKFFFGVAFTVLLIATHAMLTGGVEYYELEGRFSDEVVRKGILGVGVGNANFSAFLLNIGLVCLWYFTHWNVPIKLLCSFPMVYSLILTRSMSGILGFLLVICLSVLLLKNKLRTVHIFAWGILGIIVAYQVYVNLPLEMHFEELDLLLERIEDKLMAFEGGDYAQATSGRSDIASRFLDYIFKEQNLLGAFFGGNSLQIHSVSNKVAHNTYIGNLLQFGLVGTMVFIIYVFNRIFKTYKNREHPYRRPYLILKLLCLFIAFGMSLYENSMWMLWFLILVFL